MWIAENEFSPSGQTTFLCLKGQLNFFELIYKDTSVLCSGLVFNGMFSLFVGELRAFKQHGRCSECFVESRGDILREDCCLLRHISSTFIVNVSDSYDLEETTRNLKSKSFIDVVLEVENAMLEDGVQREKQGISRLRQLLSKEFFSEEV